MFTFFAITAITLVVLALALELIDRRAERERLIRIDRAAGRYGAAPDRPAAPSTI
jgi:hypothetical protein